MSTEEPESITVYSDYVCPFCYLGRRSLERYQESREEELRVEWHPFDLRRHRRGPDGEIDPDAEDGKDEAYYERAKQNVRRLKERYGAEEMSLDLSRDVDSLNAQAASLHVRDAREYDEWRAFDAAIFEALWHDGRDVGDPDVLADLAAEAGLDGGAVRAAIEDDALRERLDERFEEATRRGVTGVPTFVYGEHAARGAVPPEQLERLVEGAEGGDGDT
ncbi:MAG: DsbA family protein [Salinigranum sp.]